MARGAGVGQPAGGDGRGPFGGQPDLIGDTATPPTDRHPELFLLAHLRGREVDRVRDLGGRERGDGPVDRADPVDPSRVVTTLGLQRGQRVGDDIDDRRPQPCGRPGTLDVEHRFDPTGDHRQNPVTTEARIPKQA